jgi:hypothetical protein
MRVSATEIRASHEEAAALLDVLDRVDQLRLAYDVELLHAAAPWIERARDVVTRNVSSKELKRIRAGLEDALVEIAGGRADTLVADHAEKIDRWMRELGALSGDPSQLVAVIIDPRSPDVPLPLCARHWPVTIEHARTIARDLADTAPGTAEWLAQPCEPHLHRVIAFTLGRIMRTTRRLPSYADA